MMQVESDHSNILYVTIVIISVQSSVLYTQLPDTMQAREFRRDKYFMSEACMRLRPARYGL